MRRILKSRHITLRYYHFFPSSSNHRITVLFPFRIVVILTLHLTSSSEPPARDEALPDLQRLLGDLESGGGDGGGHLVAPPSLFTRPEHVASYEQITELKLQMEEAQIDDYLSQFEAGVRDDVLMIGSIRLEDIQVSTATLTLYSPALRTSR